MNYDNGQNRSWSINKVPAIEIMTPLRYYGFELLHEPPNRPHSVPSDFYLFPKFKSHLPGPQFGNNSCCRGVLGGVGGGGGLVQLPSICIGVIGELY